jgi:hypothetical protein
MNNNIQNQKTLDEMINHIAEEKNIRQLLSSYEIAEIDEIHSIEHYKRDDDRIGFVVDVKETNRVERTKIIIDLRMGQPSVHQVYDALYGIGKDCDIRIVIHTNEDDDEGFPAADSYAVLSLIAKLQEDNIAVVLFEIDSSTCKIKYVDRFQDRNQINRLRNSRIPTREQFMAETFWSIYFGSSEIPFYQSWKAFNRGFRNIDDLGYKHRVICIMNGEIKIYWDENGIRFEIKQCNDSDEYLKKVLDNIIPKLEGKYGNDAVLFENVIGRLPRLYIKYSDRPFSWLYTATPMMIKDFARKIYSDASELRDEIDETIHELWKIGLI